VNHYKKVFLPALAAFAFGLAAVIPVAGAQTAQSAQTVAESAETPQVLIQRVTQEVLEIARNDKDVKAGDRKRIHQLVETKILPHVDFQRTTSMAVGRYWREASPQQQQQLIGEFRSLLMHTYAGALSQIGSQKPDFKPQRSHADESEAEVRFQVSQARGGDPMQLSYRLHKSADGWKVYDVNLLGAWLIETYKGSFAAEIGKSGIDGLIRSLAEKNRKLAGAPVPKA
jgi:phospholipid transport system substrate-binding protein